MKFRSTVLRATALLLLVASLASCGGSSNGLVAFVPARILVFGDESSVITADGRKYTINALSAEGTSIDCTLNQIWVQVLASYYNLVFPECPGTSTDAPASRILAKAGATAGGTAEIDLVQQVTRQLELPVADGGGISSNDMVTLLVGVNDVVVAFERYQAGLATSDEAVAQVEAAGVALGTQANRIADAGGKVILSSVPDVSLMPFGQSRLSQDPAGFEFLSFLTERLNLTLQVTFTNNGRKIGYIQINPDLINVIGNPTYYLFDNVVSAACLPPNEVPGWTVLNCTDDTLQPGATAYNWLWADLLQLSPGGHSRLGNLAVSRAQNQPF